MTPLHSEIASRVSHAYDVIGRIATLRAVARAKEIERLSGGRIALSAPQVNDIANELKAELIGDAARSVRHTLDHYIAVNEFPKA